MATNISHWLKVQKSVFWSAFGFSNIAFIIPSHFFIIVPYLTLLILDFRVSNSLDPVQAPTFCQALSGYKLFTKVMSRQEKSPLAGNELNTKHLIGTNFLLKPLAKVNLAPTFSVWLKCRLQQILSQGKPCHRTQIL